jgi:hypothetical protein
MSFVVRAQRRGWAFLEVTARLRNRVRMTTVRAREAQVVADVADPGALATSRAPHKHIVVVPARLDSLRSHGAQVYVGAWASVAKCTPELLRRVEDRAHDESSRR